MDFSSQNHVNKKIKKKEEMNRKARIQIKKKKRVNLFVSFKKR